MLFYFQVNCNNVYNSLTGDYNGTILHKLIKGANPRHLLFCLKKQFSRLLLNGAELVAVHKRRYYKRHDGLAIGLGPFVSCLEYATGCKSTIIGKLSRGFFLGSLKDMDCEDEASIFMIDDVSI